MPVANSVFCASKISWNLFIAVSPDILQSARLNGVDRGVVPITIQTRDFAVRVVAYDIGVSDAVGLAFRYKTWDIRRHCPTELRLYHDDVLFGLDHFVYLDTEIRHGPQQAAPDLFKATPDGHEAFLAIRKVSSLCAVSAKSQHAVDIMSVIGGEKLSGDRLHIVVFIHSRLPWALLIAKCHLHHGQNHPKPCLAGHHPRVGFRGAFKWHGFDHGGDVAKYAESERRVAPFGRTRYRAIDTELLEKKFERRQLNRLIGGPVRNPNAAASQAAECGCDRLAARGGSQHYLRAPAPLERLGDIRRIAVDIVISAQVLRKPGPVGPP